MEIAMGSHPQERVQLEDDDDNDDDNQEKRAN